MVHRKQQAQPGRRVWRVTQAAPNGEYVDASAVAVLPRTRGPVGADPVPEPGWLSESNEWTRGVEVTDETDSIRGELFDELFMKK